MVQPKLLSDLLRGLIAASVPVVTVTGLALDSRQVQRGDVFLALAGVQARGHEFIDSAIENGAVAVLYDADSGAVNAGCKVPCIAVAGLAHKVGIIAERFFDEPSRELFMVGVTGTNGKTSCTQFLAQAYHDDAPCGVIGTIGNGFYGALDVASHTTPDAVSLHRLLRQLRDQGATRVVMEVSSHGLDQGRVAGVNFNVAVFTNLSRDHLDYHGDMAAYGRAKSRLFSLPGLRWAVINTDDAFGHSLVDEIPESVGVVTYGMEEPGVLRGDRIQGQLIRLDRQGLVLAVDTPWGQGMIKSPLLGRFNASNLLAVLGALLASGIKFETAVQRLQRLNTVPGRMEHFGKEGQPLVVVDYAHSPDALYQVLTTLREHCAGKLWCVFGCGGNRDRGKRPLMGEVAEQYADQVVITNDNPRREDPQMIIDEIRSGMKHSKTVTVIADRASAIAHAVRQAGIDDVVLIAGKGHEDYQQIGDVRHPFSDRAQVQALLGMAA
ncbi:MAG: UDP-N-acetylmuramoyl-L-alanyl-D-glutamate--2,6-diaminopimelate ligase [Gammaproteobacteria bacterium]|nr:UDP-N-acetylmuramoyl-L-alanyl-D-glutamate--2,6-diaminopimelate ligase [Gammaproteobacteria bacterium]